jgi:AraC family transcriptional regulator
MREEYALRINRVIDYIESNLDKELLLETLADVACFSPYHFHRIFSAVVGESLGQFIQRLRLERAASRLANNPKESITEIALRSGFSGSASFARAFKKNFGMTAGRWRELTLSGGRNICEEESNFGMRIRKKRQELFRSSLYIEGNNIAQTWRVQMKEKSQVQGRIEVKEVPEMQVAYVRHIGPYAGNEKLFQGLFAKLMGWAGPRGLLRFPEMKTLTIYYDDPSMTDESKLRVDACISVPKGTPAEGEIGSMVIPGGKNAVARFEISQDQYGDAWNTVYGGWMPQSGYQPDDRPCYEVYLNNPEEHPERKHIIEIHAPVKPL